jgi:hypothetical protein
MKTVSSLSWQLLLLEGRKREGGEKREEGKGKGERGGRKMGRLAGRERGGWVTDSLRPRFRKRLRRGIY